MLLAATAQRPSQKQSSAPVDNDIDPSAKPPVESSDTRTNSGQKDEAPANTAQTASSAPRADSKRDKKDDDEDDSDRPGDGDTPQAQTPIPAAPILAAVVPPPVNPQTLDVVPAAPDSDTGQTARTDAANNVPKIDPAAPQAAGQPVNDNIAAVQTSAAIPAANDDDTGATDVLPPPAPAAVSTTGNDKPVTGKPAKAAVDQSPMATNSDPVADATAMAQAAITMPAPASATGTSASDTAAATQIASIAAPATNKNGTSDAPSTDKPSQPASPAGKPATVPAPVSLPVTASPVAVAHTEMAKDNGSPKSNSDTRPAHAGDAQPDVPALPPQPMPAPSIPQHIVPNGFGIAPPMAATANPMVTSSVQITTADAEPSPDLDVLAVSVAARAMSGAKQFEIRLDPPELGRVDVRLSIDASGKTQAHMTADQPQTLDLLQKDATSLTQALRDAGLDVSQGGLNFSLRGQDRQTDDGNNGAGQGRRTNLIATRAIQAVQSPSAISFNGAAADARVDIHV